MAFYGSDCNCAIGRGKRPKSWRIRIADRLAEVEHGSAEADAAIHRVLHLTGPLLDYTTDEDAARSLLPKGFSGGNRSIRTAPSMPPVGAPGWTTPA